MASFMFLLCLIFLFIQKIQASEGWWSTPRSEDDQYYYYVASSEGEDSITTLEQKAFNRALAELIREHFGMGIQVNENSVEQLRQEEYQIITQQNSQAIFLKGVSLVKTNELSSRSGQRVFVQLRADKKMLEESKKIVLGKAIFNIYGEDNETKIDYKIKTIPQGALIHFVHLDRKFSLQGQGDALFNLPPGRYQMVINLPGYRLVNKEVNLLNSGREEVIKLEKLEALYLTKFNTSNVKIEINGTRDLEKNIKLAVGMKNTLRFIHPDFYPLEKEITLHSTDTVEEEIILTPRPSTLYYKITPHDAVIEVDGQAIKHRDGKFEVQMGKRNISISREGHVTYSEIINVVPNRDYPLKVVNLALDDKSISPGQKGLTCRFEYNPMITYGTDPLFMFYPFALHFEYHFFSLGFGLNSVNHKSTDEASKIDEEIRLEDRYLTLRLISPRFKKMKFYGAWTYGQYEHRKIINDESTIWKKNNLYHGFGAGVRAYLSPKVSIHGEYFEVNSHIKEFDTKKKENRLILGVAYEF
jgi:hypothetical protein